MAAGGQPTTLLVVLLLCCWCPAAGGDHDAQHLPVQGDMLLPRPSDGRRLSATAPDVVASLKNRAPPTVGTLRMLFIVAAWNDTNATERYRYTMGHSRAVNPRDRGTKTGPMAGMDAESTSSLLDPMRHVDRWYRTVSRGQLRFQYEYAAVELRRPKPNGTPAANLLSFCPGGSGSGYDSIMHDALEQLAQRSCSLNASNYDLVGLVFPAVAGCTGAVASTPGALSWFNGFSPAAIGGIVGLRTLVHEIGHNLGLHHSSFMGAGGALDYGDVSDVMGKGISHLNAAYQHHLGWLLRLP